MKKYWFYGGILVMLLLMVAACAPVEKTSTTKDSAGRRLGDPTGRVVNPELSCVGYCSGYAASGNEWCFCDIPCSKNGNCCSDFETSCPNEAAGKPNRSLNQTLSCVGHCTGYAESESGEEWCFCDAPCRENGNCCSDFESACPEVAS